jgi:hypothetical protein
MPDAPACQREKPPAKCSGTIIFRGSNRPEASGDADPKRSLPHLGTHVRPAKSATRFSWVVPRSGRGQVPSLFYGSQRRRTVIFASAAVRAHPRRVCEGDFPLWGNSSRADRPARCLTWIDIFEQATGGTPRNAAPEGPLQAFSRGQGAGVPSADRIFFLFLCYWPKAINLPDTPASGVVNPEGSGATIDTGILANWPSVKIVPLAHEVEGRYCQGECLASLGPMGG